jgi:hypothetical protein
MQAIEAGWLAEETEREEQLRDEKIMRELEAGEIPYKFSLKISSAWGPRRRSRNRGAILKQAIEHEGIYVTVKTERLGNLRLLTTKAHVRALQLEVDELNQGLDRSGHQV